MKCDRCENEATVHEVTVRNGVKIERHLCEKCARDQGIVIQPEVPIGELLSKYVMNPPATPSKPKRARSTATCPSCSLTYAQFHKSGLLGCPECYKAFESQLGPLLQRTHEGATHHTGKLPKRALAESRSSGDEPRVLGGLDERRRRIELLRKQLAEAVDAEQYERAAKLRDEMHELVHAAGSGESEQS
jgi:protein arginine kinase activator